MYEQQSLLTADLDEIIDATGHNDAQPQEQAQEAPAVKYYPIDEETARRAHEMMSMRDYPAGRATNEYRPAWTKPPPWLIAARPPQVPTTTASWTPYLTATPAASPSGRTTTTATAQAVPVSLFPAAPTSQ